MLDKVIKINAGLDKKFPNGKDPFQIITRLVEECGELASEVNHFENTGVKKDKHGEPDKKKLAKEIQDVLRSALQICAYYKADKELEESINNSLEKLKRDGFIE
ncbi:MAG: MazG nucleotide pyrophosphohydrolase domain-containing protein [bacterium]